LFPPPIKLAATITEILLKVALSTTNLQPKPVPYFGNKIIYIILTSVAACGCEVAPSNFSESPTGGCFTLILVVLFPF
jgi:hypothetical protein